MDRIISFSEDLRARVHLISLTNRVIIGASLILVVVIGLFTFHDVRKRTAFHFNTHEERAYEISDTVMRSIEYPMLDGAMEDVQAILEKLNRLKDMTVVELCDTKGIIRYSGLPGNIGSFDDSQVTKNALETSSLVRGLEISGDEKTLHHAMPIPNEKACYKCHGSKNKILGVLSVGINWTPIEESNAALRNRKIISGIVSISVVGIFLSLFLSKYFTQPISTLTRLADEISLGNPGFEFGRTLKCWEVEKCDKTDCPAYGNPETMCWFVDGTLCKAEPSGKFPEKMRDCRKCAVYKFHAGDEIVRLADSFKHMLYWLKGSEKKLQKARDELELRVKERTAELVNANEQLSREKEEHKRAEKEVRRSEEKYRLLFNDDPNPLFLVEKASDKILNVNNPAVTMYQFSREEMLGMSLFVLLDSVDAGRLRKKLGDLEEKGKYAFVPKLRARKKDGSHFFMDLHARVGKFHETEHGQLGLSIIIRTVDITGGLERQAQLVQASKMATLGEMATGIAHELNQPLNVIRVGTDFFSKMTKRGDKISDAQLLKVSRNIGEQVDRATNIVNHLREFGRKSGSTFYPVDLNEPIQDVFKLMGQQLKLRNIEVSLNLAEGLPKMLSDKNQLEQIFVNLITNARDAMEVKGLDEIKKLTVTTYQEGDTLVSTISDTGVGMPLEIQEKIFEPFFTTKEVGKGTGVGLSITYGLVRDFKGDIDVESTPDTGTTFRIRLPVYKEKESRQ